MTVPQSQIAQDIRNYLESKWPKAAKMKHALAHLRDKYNERVSRESKPLIKQIALE